MYTIYIVEDELLHICRPFSESYSELEGSKKWPSVRWNGFEWEATLMTIDSCWYQNQHQNYYQYQHPHPIHDSNADDQLQYQYLLQYQHQLNER